MRKAILAGVAVLLVQTVVVFALPTPKEGLLIRKDQVNEVRNRVAELRDSKTLKGIKSKGAKAVAEWPKVKRLIAPHIGEALDLVRDRNPRKFVPREAIY